MVQIKGLIKRLINKKVNPFEWYNYNSKWSKTKTIKNNEKYEVWKMMQVVKQTKEEQLKMYMRLTKTQLAEMLVEANRLLDEPPIPIWKVMALRHWNKYKNTPIDRKVAEQDNKDWLH